MGYFNGIEYNYVVFVVFLKLDYWIVNSVLDMAFDLGMSCLKDGGESMLASIVEDTKVRTLKKSVFDKNNFVIFIWNGKYTLRWLLGMAAKPWGDFWAGHSLGRGDSKDGACRRTAQSNCS